MNEAVSSVIAYSREGGRVCPQPQLWNALWEILLGRRRVGVGWEPPAPLILAAWDHTSNLEKMLRLTEHIEWADKHGNLAEVVTFLRNLSEADWHHLNE
jgi:hypothetical protein